MRCRTEDGIVLVRIGRRGWRMCVRVPIQEGAFNHKTGKAESTLCYPRIEVGCRR